MRIIASCLLLLLLGNSTRLPGQCPTAGFDLPLEACLNERIALNSTSLNSAGYEWLSCDTDYTAIQAATKVVSGFGSVYYPKMLRYSGDTFLFFVSQSLNKLVGLRVTDLASFSYVVHTEIDLSGWITNPAGLDLVYEGGRWVGLVANIVSPFKLIRFVLHQDLQSITEYADLSSVAGFSTPLQVKFVTDGGNYYAFVTNSTAASSQQLVRLNFGSSVLNLPSADYIAFPVSGQSASITFHRVCDDLTAFVSLRTGKILRISFGAVVTNTAPTITDLTLSSAINDPGGLALVEDHDELVLVIQSRNGGVYAGKLESVADNTLEISDFGNIKSSSRDWGIEIFRIEGNDLILTANFTNGGSGGFYTLNFPQVCPANIGYSQRPTEIISFLKAGTFKVTLNAKNAEGISHSLTKEIVVHDLTAPQLTINHSPVHCLSSLFDFSYTSDITTGNPSWTFGDGTGSSSGASGSYKYETVGTYMVSVIATANNGCRNSAESSINIYDPPISNFTLPPNLLCTNNQLLFSTTTPDTYNGHLSYQWRVEDSPVSTERDLQYTFTTTGPKKITLVTSIPGCADEMSQTTSPVVAGPVVDFSFTGTCEQEMFSFKNELSEPVESLFWDFDNGNTSADPDPSQIFSSYGSYSVSLTATNSAGCQSVKNRTVEVHSKPVIDFTAAGPPNACTGTSTLFQNQTTNPDGREVTVWLWDFNDSGSPDPKSEREPAHVFQIPDTYSVSLSATTAASCQSTAQRNITIHPAPSTSFTRTPACDDLPVSFTGPQTPEIDGTYWEIGTSYYLTASPTHTFKSPGDYRLYLRVTSSNGCIAAVTETIHVPIPLNPDFSVLKNCVGQEAIFTDITMGVDPVVLREWSINQAEAFTGSPLAYTFTGAGNQNVALKVITAAGCNYTISKPVRILEPPVASFSASPQTGAYPFEVAFTNASTEATHYRWEFLDGSGNTSTETSPVYTFLREGSIDVKLTAFSPQECEAVYIGQIASLAPLPDGDVEMISLTPNPDGTVKLIVMIHNKGNTILRNVPLDIDFSGNLALRQNVDGPVLPGARHNYVFSTGIVNAESLRYLCAHLQVENDLSPRGNRMCTEFEDKTFVFSAYPNPTQSILNLDWISEKPTIVRIALTDALGKTILERETPGGPGLNQRTLELGDLAEGVYYLRVEEGMTVNHQRILISAER